MNSEFNDGFDEDGLFVGHDELHAQRLENELNTYIVAGQKLIVAGDAMCAVMQECSEKTAWKELRKKMILPEELPKHKQPQEGSTNGQSQEQGR